MRNRFSKEVQKRNPGSVLKELRKTEFRSSQKVRNPESVLKERCGTGIPVLTKVRNPESVLKEFLHALVLHHRAGGGGGGQQAQQQKRIFLYTSADPKNRVNAVFSGRLLHVRRKGVQIQMVGLCAFWRGRMRAL
uniref:Brix domain-containing protein n=1 Tax=Globodera pallida TaxID=36090 RepID=A0A183CF08_GLOPA